MPKAKQLADGLCFYIIHWPSLSNSLFLRSMHVDKQRLQLTMWCCWLLGVCCTCIQAMYVFLMNTSNFITTVQLFILTKCIHVLGRRVGKWCPICTGYSTQTSAFRQQIDEINKLIHCSNIPLPEVFPVFVCDLALPTWYINGNETIV